MNNVIQRIGNTKVDVTSLSFVMKLFLALNVFSFWILNFLSDYEYNQSVALYGSILLLVISIYSAFKVRKHLALFILFLFILYCNYSIVFFDYFNDNSNEFYGQYSHTSVAMIGLMCLLLFNIIICIFLPKNIKEISKQNKFIKEENKNPLLVTITIIAMILILILGFDGPSEVGGRGIISTYYEYSSILLIVGLYYVGKNKFLRIILLIIALHFCLFEIIHGGRIVGLQLLIIVLMVNFYYTKRYIIYLSGFICVCLLLLVGLYRANLTITRFEDGLTEIVKNGFTMDTSYAAYHASLTFILTKNISTISKRFNLFTKFLLSMILGGSLITDSNLADYTYKYFSHSGGGILPIYMFFYLGLFGVVLISLLVALYIRKISINPSNGLKYCMFIYFIATTPRWYLYSPSSLIRGIMILIVVFYLYKLVNKLMKS